LIFYFLVETNLPLLVSLLGKLNLNNINHSKK
jgi:hypothetical protein